ncbi:hypothetical protein [Acidovorax sp.]|uniref:hypothetical protein n=1 Tax=Acidovorax sp. TaxID=1872122 RepID=UPI000BC83002|nr:hypothetical protein [Acidovorax sp.]OYW66317.1 MAG: hypothetical protein B7Z32_00545 [Hydrogenophilales bacterium 12-64-13]OYZ05887.1 MAG: hypothetical protein B7Y26_06075 [Hydrogenophilales bacterium 16-64-46]OZA39823.1 MAG: hypothetical protein B7X87_02100 [Hydrogenophilales bacterium 17-64-34]HQT00243.1 hypothetical protein [Thiobacillus sp.]
MNTTNTDPRLAIVETTYDCDTSEQAFGKRWRQEILTLTEAQIEALRQGKRLAVDVQGEYGVYLKLDAVIEANLRELGYGR